MANLDEHLEPRGGGDARGGTSTGPGMPTRPTRSSPSSSWRRGSARWSRSSPWSPRRSGSTRPSRPGITANETDLAELIVQLGHDKPSHILVPAIHRNRAEVREIFLREMPGVDRRPDRRPAGAGHGRAGPPEAEVPHRQGRRQRRQLRRRRHRHAARRRVRGQRPDVPDPARDADHRDGHREGRADVARPRGVPPAAAAVVDRRADEPVHVGVDRRHTRRRAAGVPPRAARQRAYRDARRRRRPRGAALHQVQRLHERLPGLRAHRRSRLRLGLPGPDRRRARPRS